ncbi:MAG TPA: ATP-binding cassette domain-containing protein [Candidatus Saccharimonadales bacterium]
MSKKLHAFRWFIDQFKALWILSVITALVAAAAGVLTDVVVPYMVAQILGMVARGATFGELVDSLLILTASAGGGCILGPLRLSLCRELQDRGHSGLMDAVQKIVLRSPSLSWQKDHGIIMAAMSEFFGTWQRIVQFCFNSVIRFVASIVGLSVVMWFHMPAVILPCWLLLAGIFLFASKFADVVGATWSTYIKRRTHEYSIMGNLVKASQMAYLTERLVPARELAGKRRSIAMRAYRKRMVQFQVALAVLNHGFKVIGVLCGALMATVFGAGPEAATILIVFGLTLSEQMNVIFSLNDVISGSAVDAEPLIRQLEESKALGPEIGAKNSVVEFKNVTVRYTDEESSDVVVRISDMLIKPGITLLWGPSGCGKTSALMALSRAIDYETSHDGYLTIDGFEVRNYDTRKVVVFGQQSLDTLNMKVRALFRPRRAGRWARQRALWCVGYSMAPTGRLLKSLSGGQRERVLRGSQICAILQRDHERAGVLLLDEPTNNLGDYHIHRLIQGLTWLRGYDPELAIVLVSHDPRFLNVADSVVEMAT